jgi:hypothetical protein
MNMHRKTWSDCGLILYPLREPCDAAIELAIQANNQFVQRLERIAAEWQGECIDD